MHDFTATLADLATIAANNDVEMGNDDPNTGLPRNILASYSGRHMNGRRCVAIVHTSEIRADLLTFDLAVALAGPDAEDIETVRDILADLEPQQDTLGYGLVTYWKNVAVGEFVTGRA